MQDLAGKKVVIFGVANERSIAWGMAKKFKAAGAHIALSYLGDSMKKRVEPLAEEIGADFIFDFDVTNQEHMNGLQDTIKQYWKEVDVLVHSVAFANREDLKNPFIQTSREGFLMALEISAYSLVGIARELAPIMPAYSSIMAMTYHGSQQVIPQYNVMGVAKAALESSVRYLAADLGESKIRVNAISAGPIKTLAASGISGFRDKLKYCEEHSAMKENIDQGNVADLALFLGSKGSTHITGQTLYIDSGLAIMGV
jgi:enoyl-[acyl-carrier protein] reductase I